jgi:type II secretory pathway predicted ATPase ExeA
MPIAPDSNRQTYFSFDALEQRLDLLRGLINSRDNIVLVVGEQGIGKTTFLSQFLQTSRLKWQNYRLQTGGATSMASTSNGSAYVLRSKPYQTILIDDAHLLEPATLKSLLIRFVRGTKEGLVNRLILFGDPSIKSNLTDCLPFLSDNTAVGNIHLPVMNQAETSQYLSYLLSVAGISQSRLLNRRVVNKIYRSTGGVPGLVKQEA